VRTLGRGLAPSTWPLLLLAHLEMHQWWDASGRGLRALDKNLVRLVDLGPPLQQQPHHRLVAVLGRQDEARRAGAVEARPAVLRKRARKKGVGDSAGVAPRCLLWRDECE
jgi:hypothetical protein